MKKDFAKRHRRSSRATNTGQTPWRWIVMMAVLGVLICCGLIVYQYKKNPQQYPQVAAYATRLSAWIDAHRSHLKQDLVKVKKLAVAKNDAEPEIHFEFYTALPNMQINGPALAAASQQTVKKDKTQTNVADSETVAQNTTPLVNPDSLEQEISAQLNQETNQSQYVLQLGIFRSQESAEHYQSTLADAGFKAFIVKEASAEKKVFRVQVGPFNNKNQARLAQINLEKKGFNGLMRKIEV